MFNIPMVIKFQNRRHFGNILIAVIPFINIALWIVFPPIDDGTRSNYFSQYLGEIIGSTMMLMMAITLLLSTRFRFIEPLFGGLDKMYLSHRNAGVTAFLLLILHYLITPIAPSYVPPGRAPGYIAFFGFVILIIITLAPRLPVIRKFVKISYRRWRVSHKFIGIFFIMGTAHVLLVDSLVLTTLVPFIVLMFAIVVGIVSYLYTELLAKFARRTASYKVKEINHLNKKTVEVVLKPEKKQLNFKAGQFIFVRFKGDKVLSEPHPFTVSSSPSEENLRLTITSAGDFTQYLYKNLKTGFRAVVEGSYGMMDYRKGGREQIWIAGGVGVTPFLSWIRDMPHELNYRIDFYYNVKTHGDELFLSEILEAEQRHDLFFVHINYSKDNGRLTIEDIVKTISGRIVDKHIYMCGPTPMLTTFNQEFQRYGIPASSIHYEEFSFR
ncbi:MAG: ferredoxin reductase family protein [Bacillota bacterium]